MRIVFRAQHKAGKNNGDRRRRAGRPRRIAANKEHNAKRHARENTRFNGSGACKERYGV